MKKERENFMKNMQGRFKKRIIRIMLSVRIIAVFVVSAAAVTLNAFAAERISKGNLSADGGCVAFRVEDVDYLGGELDSLQNEIDYSVVEGISEGIPVTASADIWTDEIDSHGVINYDNGKMLLNAVDFAALADRTYALADAYTVLMCRALNGIGTYFDAGGNVNHEAQTGNSIVLGIGQIAEGIRQSQSIDNPAFSSVTAENLTAGTAAWVNGQCIIGNGADNENSYRRGREDGEAGNDSDMDLQYTYHEHIGNGQSGWDDGAVIAQESSPGGCFTTGYHEHNYNGQSCRQVAVGKKECHCDGWKGEGSGGGCRGCGHTEGSHSDRSCNAEITVYGWNCGEPINHWQVGCGRKVGQIDSVTVVVH